ncbi:DUF3656 domain-containing U32 family peptidase [Rosistilla oblonga]|uniref:DUF3656 domain-containing U32 family peptidase n=1 Tax=Rosistilla oblonga TaxID=2527990 RepID=UPI003A9768B8
MSTPSLDRSSPLPPELLAPAGDIDCVRAAIENGADAVYFGLDCGFNARARAHNFGPADLPEVMDLLHSRGLAGYVTLNTLIFPSELPAIADLLRQISDANVDAVLVQDLGLVRLVRQLVPDLPIHASTQMTMTSAQCIDEIESLGIERVVVGRELSVREIKAIAQKTTMPLECFIHGALCVAYSGQCLTSESLGGRSANRGQCAQACRLPYELIVDGQDRDLGDQKYLLSPQDLAGYALIPDLIDAGVCSLKIEGRLKTPEYVANIVRHYRKAIDDAMAGRAVHLTETEVREMELSFSRGFSPGWLEGCEHKRLVPGQSSAKRGVRAGTVIATNRRGVIVDAEIPLNRGDGVVFDGDRDQQAEQGGRLFDVRALDREDPSRVELQFGTGAIDFDLLEPGQAMWKTDDPKLNQKLKRSYSQTDPIRRRPLRMRVTAAVDQPLRVVAEAAGMAAVEIESDQVMQEARKHPIDEATLHAQLGRMGGTAFELAALSAKIVGRPMLPLSVLGRLRRELVAALEAQAIARPPRRYCESALADLQQSVSKTQAAAASEAGRVPTLHILCRTMDQMQSAIDAGMRDLYADFHDIREYRGAVAMARQAEARIVLATPRIQKPDEFGLFRAMRRHQPDGYLVRNLAGLRYYRNEGFPVIADFSLNATNEISADHLIAQGATRITPSYDLNRQQLTELIEAVPSGWLEIVVHQHMPMFHMEHCVFCSVLSPGTNKTNCGRPCDRHVVHLRDRAGMEHPLQADVACRNTLFNAAAQSAAEIVPSLISAGVAAMRIELLEETGPEIARTIELYQQLLRGEVTGKEVWTQLRASNRVGVTRGTLEERRNPLTIL